MPSHLFNLGVDAGFGAHFEKCRYRHNLLISIFVLNYAQK
jgi:hypothetical protein